MTDSQPARGSVLRPCPFCGSPPVEQHYPTLHTIGCASCGIRMAGKGIMSDAETRPLDGRPGMVEFIGPGTLDHERALRASWNARVAGGGGEVTDEMVDAAQRAYDAHHNAPAGLATGMSYSWSVAMRAALVAALQVKP